MPKRSEAEGAAETACGPAIDYPTRGNTALALKLLLVGLAVAVAWLRQIVARKISPALRGALEGILLLLALGILAAAVAL